ncbi:hypothetical protein [Nonomuraea jabiensis]|uniref:hypothetical protein n=1 Tax=Nonomuraea jabiensis TaxID=882448 RepID=UPI0036BB7988
MHEAAWLERNLLEAGLPPWNRTPDVETSLYIVVDPRPRTAGVRTSHVARFDGVVGFGPYLGGTRARQAVSGLHRTVRDVPSSSSVTTTVPSSRRIAQPDGVKACAAFQKSA